MLSHTLYQSNCENGWLSGRTNSTTESVFLNDMVQSLLNTTQPWSTVEETPNLFKRMMSRQESAYGVVGSKARLLSVISTRNAKLSKLTYVGPYDIRTALLGDEDAENMLMDTEDPFLSSTPDLTGANAMTGDVMDEGLGDDMDAFPVVQSITSEE